MLDRVTSTPLLGRTEETKFDPREFLNFAWRQWKFIGGVTALVLLIGAVYLARQVPVYTAAAQVLLDPSKEKAGGAQDAILTDAVLDDPMLESQMAIIRSTVLLRRVVEKERLVSDPEFGSRPSAGGWTVLSTIHSFFAQSTPSELASPKSGSLQGPASSEVTATVENLKGSIAVSRTGLAYLINISVKSVDPARAARLANAVADAYVVDKLDARFEAARRASGWLGDRLDELRKQLRESEQAVAQFRADNNLVGSTSATTLNQEQLGQLNARLVSTRADTAEKKARLDLLDRVTKAGGSLASLPDAMNSPGLADLRKQESDISRKEADLLARYSDRHPSVVNVRAEMSDVRRAISAELQRQAGNVKNEYELAKARQDAIEKTLRELTGQTDLDNSKAITLRELERTAAVNKSMFEDFLQRAKITQEQSTFQARDLRVITPALPPDSPSAPNKRQTMLVALVLGLMAGLGGAYLLERLNAGFTSPRQVEDMLHMPLLASISHFDDRDLTVEGAVIPIALYPVAKPLSRLSEAMRSLRSGIQMADVDNPPKVLQVTSTMPGEGKTTIALTLATSAAQSGMKVMFIDADLRRPAASRFFKMDQNHGLVEYLIGAAQIKDIVEKRPEAGYWVLPAGGKTQNPSDLLNSEKFRELISQLKKNFDLVIIDTPPTGPVIDATVVSQSVDKVIFIVKWAATAREMVERAVEHLQGHKKIAGIVFNHVNDNEAQKYGKYAYYYGGSYYKTYYTG